MLCYKHLRSSFSIQVSFAQTRPYHLISNSYCLSSEISEQIFFSYFWLLVLSIFKTIICPFLRSDITYHLTNEVNQKNQKNKQTRKLYSKMILYVLIHLGTSLNPPYHPYILLPDILIIHLVTSVFTILSAN